LEISGARLTRTPNISCQTFFLTITPSSEMTSVPGL
jgi:hypothetical protein